MTFARTPNTWSIWCLPVLLLAAACDKSSSEQPEMGTNEVTSAYERLQNALAECGRTASQCAQDAQGDMAALQTCRDQLSSCRESAGSSASDALVDAIQTCIDSSKQCQQDAGDSSAHLACKDELKACLGANRPGSESGDDDGGADDRDGGSHSPVSACVDEMRDCVLADGSAQTCADQMLACVLAATPAPDDLGPGQEHQPPADAGMSGEPHEPPADAGMAGEPHEPPADAGMSGNPQEPPADAGMPSKPSCQQQYDACIAANGSRPVCSQMLRQCNKPAKP